MPPFFDEHGRAIPAPGAAGVNQRTRRYFRIVQPEIDYGASFGRLEEHLRLGGAIAAGEFAQRCEAILERLRADERTKDLLAGVRVPFALPRAAHDDVGAAFESTYLPAVSGAFTQVFPDYRFTNHVVGSLAGRMGTRVLGRHDRLLEAMRRGHVVGWLFPCLTEYAPPAAAERVEALPEQFLLAGAFDTAAAFVSAPALLRRTDGYSPVLFLAGVSGDADGASHQFEAYGHNLTFNRRAHRGEAAETWTGAVVVLG